MMSNACLVLFVFLLALPLFSVANSTHPVEVNALLSIKARLVDPHGNLKTWDNKTDPCSSWTGVICSTSTDGQGYRHVAQLELFNKNLSGNLAPEIGQLQYLQILDFMWNNISGTIPKEVGSNTDLRLLLLNGNHLSGPLPEELGNLSRLDRIQIDQNSISGPIPKSFAKLQMAKHFHMNNNSLNGDIPKELSTLPNLLHLLLDNNKLTGELPSELAEMPQLLILQLDNNNFSNSEIPVTYANMSKLLKLSVRNCSLRGPVPDFSSIPNLGYLDLSYNNFDGNIPTEKLSSNITTIDLSYNNLNGSIPLSFAELPLLQKLSLESNSLTGSVPSDIGSSIKFSSTATLLLDFRNNKLDNITDITDLERLPGNISLRLDGNPICTTENKIDMSRFCSSNNTTEDINESSNNTDCPKNACSPPYVLFPDANCYCVAPISVGYRLKSPGISAFPAYKDMFEKYLTVELNLSLKQLSIQSYEWKAGPRLAMNLKFLPLANETVKLFNQSEISRIQSTFAQWRVPDSDIFGPYEFINTTVGEPYTNGNGANRSGLSSGALAGVLIGTILGTLIISALIGTLLFRRYAKYLKHSTRRYHARMRVKVSGVRDFDFDEMASATNNFCPSMKIGRGGYGDVYKGVLDDGTVVAIKRAREGALQGEMEFANELELLSRLHHRNLVSLVGYCDDQDEQMLVYEYMPNGTLKDHLSGSSGHRPLDFGTRLRLALGAAKGILYLHTEADPPIIHRDIKATNILLDGRFIARVADFGLSRLAPFSEGEEGTPGYVSTVVKGTPGYLDPEYFLTHKLTDKSDVYSFGVVLLELLTGMEPISYGKNLVRQVSAARSSGTVLSMIDPHMVSYPSECMESFIQLALQCCQEETDSRPSMVQVVKALTTVQMSMSTESMTFVESWETKITDNPKMQEAFTSSEASAADLYRYSPFIAPR